MGILALDRANPRKFSRDLKLTTGNSDARVRGAADGDLLLERVLDLVSVLPDW